MQGPFNKDRNYFVESLTEWWLGVRRIGSVERSPTTHVHFSSVACWYALRQEVNFCDVWLFVVSSRQQRYAEKFYFKLGKSTSGIFELMEAAYGDDALSCKRVLEWHKMFKEGRELIGRPTKARTDVQVAKVKKVLDSDRLHLTFSCFREWKGSSKDIGSTPSRPFKLRRQRLSTIFRKPTSRWLLTSGRRAELSAL